MALFAACLGFLLLGLAGGLSLFLLFFPIGILEPPTFWAGCLLCISILRASLVGVCEANPLSFSSSALDKLYRSRDSLLSTSSSSRDLGTIPGGGGYLIIKRVLQVRCLLLQVQLFRLGRVVVTSSRGHTFAFHPLWSNT